MSEIKYNDTVAETILKLFKDAFGDAFHLYRVGDPILPGQSNLPAIFVTDERVNVAEDATSYDSLTHTLLIQVVFNKKDEMGRPLEGNTLDTEIDNWIMGRDPVTGQYSTRSILGILRNNLTLGNLVIQTDAFITKGVVPRPEQELTAEGHVEITVTEYQVVNRT